MRSTYIITDPWYVIIPLANKVVFFLYIGITLSVRPFCLVSATLLVRLNWVWTQLQCIKCAWRRIILVWTISRDITRGTVMYDRGYRLWFDSQFKLVLFNNHPYLCSSVKKIVNICTAVKWSCLLFIIFLFFCPVFTVSCSADMTIKLWDFQGFECLKTMYGKSFSYKHRRFVDDRVTLLLKGRGETVCPT